MRETLKSGLLLLALGICCAGTILLVLIAANASLVAGIFLDFWPAILAGLLLLIVGVIYYLRRRHRLQERHIGGGDGSENN